MPTTWCPRASSRSHRCEPMKPAAPVTTTRCDVEVIADKNAVAVRPFATAYRRRGRKTSTDLRRPCDPSALLRPPLLAYASTDACAAMLGPSTGVPVTKSREGPLVTEPLAEVSVAPMGGAAGRPRRIFGAHAVHLRCCGLRFSLTHQRMRALRCSALPLGSP